METVNCLMFFGSSRGLLRACDRCMEAGRSEDTFMGFPVFHPDFKPPTYLPNLLAHSEDFANKGSIEHVLIFEIDLSRSISPIESNVADLQAFYCLRMPVREIIMWVEVYGQDKWGKLNIPVVQLPKQAKATYA